MKGTHHTLVAFPLFGLILATGGMAIHAIAKVDDALLEVLLLDLGRIVLVAAVTTIRLQVTRMAGAAGAGVTLTVA